MFVLIMKKLLLFLSFAIFGIANAQPLNFQWARSVGGSNSDYSMNTSSISKDIYGNEYIIGYSASAYVILDSITLSHVNGGNDFFIAKYDSAGRILWAKSFGCVGIDFIGGICTDTSGNIFFTGAYEGTTITFGSFTLTNTMSNYSEDLFVVKCDSSGNVLWAKSAIGNGNDVPRAISSDINGNICITGSFSSASLNFGSSTLVNANPGYNEGFTLKYDNQGNVLWAKYIGGTSSWGFSIATDITGNVFVTGCFYGSIFFGSTTITNIGWGDIFILKYDISGNPLWAKSAGGSGGVNEDKGQGITTDVQGNVCVTGLFYSSSITFGSAILVNNGGADFFIVKYDSVGNIMWAKNSGGSTDDIGQGISTDANGNVFVTGAFGSDFVVFDNDTLNNIDPSGNTGDIFIVKYNTIGNVIWTKRAGGYNNDVGRSICNNNGDLFLIGDFYSPAISFNNATLSNNGLFDIFITKLSSIVSGISETNSDDNFINISPNPFTTHTTVQVASYEIRNTSYEVEMYDVFGRIVKQFVIRNSSFVIERGDLPSGLYFIRLATPSPSGEKPVLSLSKEGEVIATEKIVITDN